MRAVATLVAVLVATTVAGVAPVAASADPDPCALLKRKEIRKALGQPTEKGGNDVIPTMCQWDLVATSDRAAGSVYALVVKGSRAKADFDLAAEFNADDLEPVRGIGRKAFFTPSLGTVWVLVDRSTVLYVQGLYPRDATPEASVLRDALVRLAKRAETRV